ncbi:hypothetical protein VaNZ11_004443 [Volvox africanus]|uniref:Uncharacterized protein n=1 Tax=Volvox africanus TaxID=51714 RepID=A0ABQ5RWV8_9CHLO|nr:hypothetical protein VaNZ11_004443 [Volvox africanus]
MGDAAANVVATATMGVSSILMPKVVFKGDNWNEFRRDVENCFLYNGWASALTSPDDPATFKALIVLRRQVAQEYQIELSDCENAKVAWDHLKNIGCDLTQQHQPSDPSAAAPAATTPTRSLM